MLVGRGVHRNNQFPGLSWYLLMGAASSCVGRSSVQ